MREDHASNHFGRHRPRSGQTNFKIRLRMQSFQISAKRARKLRNIGFTSVINRNIVRLQININRARIQKNSRHFCWSCLKRVANKESRKGSSCHNVHIQLSLHLFFRLELGRRHHCIPGIIQPYLRKLPVTQFHDFVENYRKLGDMRSVQIGQNTGYFFPFVLLLEFSL